MKKIKVKWYVWLIAIVLLGLTVLASTGTLFSNSVERGLDGVVLESGDGELLELSITGGQAYVISLSDNNPHPLENVDIALSITVPAFNDITSATLNLTDVNGEVRSWDFTSELKAAFGCNFYSGCSSFGESTNLGVIASFNAPYVIFPPKDYSLSYRIRGVSPTSGHITLASESIGFTVTALGGACPDNSCDDWFVLESFDGGKWYQRTCTTYSDSCVATSEVDTKTSCKSGWEVPNGGRSSTSLVSCSEIVEEDDEEGVVDDDEDEESVINYVTCFRCDGKSLEANIFESSCASGWIEDNIVCDEDETDKSTCYYCSNGDVVSEAFSVSICPSNTFSSSPTSCASGQPEGDGGLGWLEDNRWYILGGFVGLLLLLFFVVYWRSR